MTVISFVGGAIRPQGLGQTPERGASELLPKVVDRDAHMKKAAYPSA